LPYIFIFHESVHCLWTEISSRAYIQTLIRKQEPLDNTMHQGHLENSSSKVPLLK